MMNLVGNEAKIFPMMGSPNEGEREAAVHQMYALLDKRKSSFLEMMENHIPLVVYENLKTDHEQLQKDFDEAGTVINDLSAKYDRLNLKYQAINGTRTALLWAKAHWKGCATAVTVLALAGGAFQSYYWQAHAEERHAVEAQMTKALERISLRDVSYTGDYSAGGVVQIGGKPYWTMLYGVTEKGTHADASGRPVTLKCAHLFVHPAISDLPGAYQSPPSFNLFGWFRWSERAVQCRVSVDDIPRSSGNEQQIGNDKPTESPDAGTLEDPRVRFPHLFKQRG